MSEALLVEADRQFLATLGHELRNPLAPLLNSLHLLKISARVDPVPLSPRADLEVPTDAPPHPFPVRRVLVVDDNEDAAELLGDLLEAVGSEVAVAHGGEDAAGFQLHTVKPLGLAELREVLARSRPGVGGGRRTPQKPA